MPTSSKLSLLFLFGATLAALLALDLFHSSAAAQNEDDVVGKIRQLRPKGTALKDGEGKVTNIGLFFVSDEDLTSLDFTVFTSLKSVMIISPRITKRSVLHLCRLPPRLEVLYLASASIDDSELAPLLQRQPSLTTIQLVDMRIGDRTLAEIAKVNRVSTLILSGSRITDAGLKHVSKMTALRILDLSDTAVSDVGVRELKGLSDLMILSLDGTKVTDEGIRELAAIERLNVLSVSRTKVTEMEKKALRAALPNLDLEP